MTEYKETEELPLLIEKYRKEIWEWKQKESQWIKDKNQLDGHKRIVEELSTKIIELNKKIREAEGETSIVKAVGSNSPEMRELQARVKQLDSSLANALEINESHQRYNGKLQREVTELQADNKKLSQQINDHIRNREDILRRAGL
jgi:chromosome segregation ATPase|tara:strand:+ start:210 stop:644 length:435 start_codon:yes stop_codon:yes gene_type:complete